MKRIGLSIALVAVLSGCQLTKVEGEYRDVEVKLNTKGSQSANKSSEQTFCPPGQAKKGRC